MLKCGGGRIEGSHPANEAMTAADATTLSRCDSDPQATIAALERNLKDKKIELPPDDRVAQSPGSTMCSSGNVVLATTMEAAAADCRRIIHARYWPQSGINVGFADRSISVR
jgi:hypothetical protein